MKKIIALLILSVGLTPAWADWVYIERTDTHNLYIRQGVMNSGVTPKGWVMFDRQPGSKHERASWIQLVEARCSTGQSRILQFASYSDNFGTGSVTGSDNKPFEWSYPPPGTVSETIFKTLCNLQ